VNSTRPLAKNEVFPANGSSPLRGQPELSRTDMRDALNEMPHLVGALAPAPKPAPEDSLDNEPGFAGPSAPAPRS
jgi:hypothetical protein